MSAAHVRRGASGRTRAKSSKKGVVPKKLVARLPVEQAQANRLAAWLFGLFAVAITGVALVALDIPSKVWLATGEAVGNAGFRVKSVDVKGLNKMDPKPVYQIALDQKTTAMPLVDVAAIRDKLLAFGWVKDARVSRRFPDTLVIDIVERSPAAIWQDSTRLNLIDKQGVVLDRVPVADMPDLPLLVGPGANLHAVQLQQLLDAAPSLKAQLVSATWVGARRWDLVMQSGETIMLPEGQDDAKTALTKFAKMDKESGLVGKGMLRFDLRIPGKMTVRLPRQAGEPILPPTTNEG